jgi:ATP-binding cassette subfamily A (ABC1) protein 3
VDNFEAKNLKKEYYEPVAADVAKLELEDKFLQISNLQKTYDNGFQAVKGVNVKMYQGQIFALLGQNGAGKTTTISMITGLLVPSEGSASCYELDVFRDMPDVRKFMGICPQHDVLFELLTPLEHLDLFYELKNGDPAKKQKEIDDLVREVGLTTDKDKMAGTLSGGNKRKLSVSVAIIGQSKLVLLDEPTSGMDLGARRGLWNMLRKYRRDRIIILTTHYMDEADVLGDRIGIMAHG